VTPTQAHHSHAPGGPGRWVHEVPTHLDVQDRALLGLTVRQLLVLASAAACGFSLWSHSGAVPPAVRVGLAAACVAAGLVLALVRPGGRGLDAWGLAALRYAAVPRRCLWRPAESGRDAFLAPVGPPGAAGPGRPASDPLRGRPPGVWAELDVLPRWAAAAPSQLGSGAVR
jgi:hypothetical protein